MNRQLALQDQMSRTYLIQRLVRPSNHINAYSDGSTRLSVNALNHLKSIFSFDYMGASEFEDGSVPASLGFIREQADLRRLVSGTHREVFYIAPTSYEEGVKQIIDQLLEDEESMRLQEPCGLAKALQDSHESRVVGWIELNNGFFLFVDRKMFERTKQLFNV